MQDLFGYTPPTKHISPKKVLKRTDRTIIEPERYYPVYRPSFHSFLALCVSIVAFFLWYVFGVELLQAGPITIKELQGPLYGALACLTLSCCLIWFVCSFVRATSYHFRSEPDVFPWRKCRHRSRAYFLTGGMISLSLFLVSISGLLIFHGFANARKFVAIAVDKLSDGPMRDDTQIAANSRAYAENSQESAAPKIDGPKVPSQQAAPGSTPLGTHVETGSLPPKRQAKKAPVGEVDPLQKSWTEIVDWVDNLFVEFTPAHGKRHQN